MSINKSILLFLVSIMFIACKDASNEPNSIKNKSLFTVKINIDNDEGVEEIVFRNTNGTGNGFSPEDLKPYSNAMEFNFNKTIDGKYLLLLRKDSIFKNTMLTLRGNDIIINGHIEGKQIIIDTVLNSPIYYKADKLIANYVDVAKRKSKKEANEYLFNEIKENLEESFISDLTATYIGANINNHENLIKIKELISNQSDSTQIIMNAHHYDLDKLINRKNITLSDFKFLNLEGEKTEIALQPNSIYLLDLWFLNCAPCIKDHKVIKTRINEFEKAKVEIIGISIDENVSSTANYLQKNDYKWRNYLDGILLIEHLGIKAFPKYFLINGKGEILYSGGDWTKCLEFAKTIN